MTTPRPENKDAERAAGLRALRDVSPPPSLIANVMREVHEPAPFSVRNWLFGRRRFQLSFTPLGLVAGAATMALIVGALTLVDGRNRGPVEAAAPRAPAPSDVAVAPHAPEVVMVRFVLNAAGAQRVTLAGDFNAWDPDATPLDPSDADHFSVTVPLRRGESHSYMFVVDGEWIADPGSSERRPDGFGNSNSIIRL